MQITKQADYAIRCILYLAFNSTGRTVMIEEISRTMDIPKSFLAKILQRLNKAGIVRSVRGIKGGFLLNRELSEISLLDVITSIDGPISLNRCAVEQDHCRRACICTVHPVWTELRQNIKDYLQGITFDRLIANTDLKTPLGSKTNP
jgi:Rrf2 family protein